MAYKGVRGWLECNKILFETVAATSLSVMAILVAIAQTKTADEQTRLLSVQTQIAEAQALPQFEIGIHQKLNEATSKYDDNYLVISNRGGAVHEFSAQDAYSVVVTVGEPVARVTTLTIPVGGYFTASYVSVASTGELVTMIGNHNNAVVVALTNSLRDAARARGLAFANLDEHLIVRLRYRDLLNRFHEDYYEVKSVSGGMRVPDDIGKADFERWYTAQHTELVDLRPDNLIDQVRQKGSAP